MDHIKAIVEYLSKYNTIDPLLAKKHFDKSLYDAPNVYYHINTKQLAIKFKGQYYFYYYYFYISPIHTYKTYCYSCCSSIRRGKCIGCSDKQKLYLENHTGVPTGNRISSQFYIYKKNQYNPCISVVQYMDGKEMLHRLEHTDQIPLLFKKWLKSYTAILAIKRFKVPTELKAIILLKMIKI